MIQFQVLSLFPDFFASFLKEGVVAQAFQKKLASLSVINPRDFAIDGHRSVDDRPYGGGDGMVMLPEVLQKAFESRPLKSDHIVYLSPQGALLNEKKVLELAQKPQVTLICGRYAGVDQRWLNHSVHEEISVGDYVLSGGELPALCLMDAVIRKIPGVLGHSESATHDSLVGEAGLEAPLFTRPLHWEQQEVPKVLLSGHHGQIADWRKKMGELVTLKKRPDLFKKSTDPRALKLFLGSLTPEEKKSCGLDQFEWPKDLV